MGVAALSKRRKQPQRTCIGCRETRDKREMVRVVRTPDGEVVIDGSGKRSGRGAYICPATICLKDALDGRRLAHALRTDVSEAQQTSLEEEMLNLLRDASNKAPQAAERG
ncbi:MAG: YlxR family protein [Thermaerobacterales bacterium]